jgi:hypothetical protein
VRAHRLLRPRPVAPPRARCLSHLRLIPATPDAPTRRLVAVHGRSGQWEAIAAALGTGRPPAACLREFATGLEAASLLGPPGGAEDPAGLPGLPGPRTGLPLFTPQMDELLREQVQALGPRWKLIGHRMGLDSRQVRRRPRGWDCGTRLCGLTCVFCSGVLMSV